VPSSISSSRSGIAEPLRIAVSATAILVAYNLLVAVAKPDAMLNFDNGIRNVVVAERYLDGAPARAVLTGSSMGFRLSTDFMEGDYLGPDVFNLSFAGKTALPGLDLILARPERPRLVFVEMNTMDRGYDRDLAPDRLSEPWFTIRRFAPGFRTENRPLDLAIVFAWRAAKEVLGDLGLSPTERVFSGAAGQASNGPPLSDSLRAIVDDNMGLLAQRVDALRAAGIRVVLLRLPSDPAMDTARSTYMWDQCGRQFTSDRYEWLDLRSTGTYETEDGVHLTKSSARRAAAVLRQIAESGKAP
jgi:hypothetical protein